MSRPRRGIALLLVVMALGAVDAVLVLLWLWSRAEAQDAVESLAVSRAEWAAAASMTEAAWWASRQAAVPTDTVFDVVEGAVDVARRASLRRVTDDLLELRAEGRVPATGPVLVHRVRCLWLVAGAPDSVGQRHFHASPLTGLSPCW